MFLPKAIFCRGFQGVFRLALPFLPYRDPTIISSLERLDEIITKENIKSVLIVTDPGIEKNGLIFPLEKVLKEQKTQYTIYDKTKPNPTVTNVEDALALYHKNHCDALIAVGGGSPMDCAKAVGARVAYPEKTVRQLGGMLKVNRKLPPLIAVPTTAGTGSETTVAALITDEETRHKYALMSFPLIPRYAVLDPTLTFSLPAHLTAATGMDALTHAVEAYIGRSTTKETRRLAIDTVCLVFENLEKAYTNGNNLTARENMLRAAYQGGIVLSKSYVGYIHAIAHSLGGKYGTPHGLANAVVMPYVLKGYGESVYKKLHRLGVEAKICAEWDSPEWGAKKFIAAIQQMNARMNIPTHLDGILESDIPEMAAYAEKEANPLYPVPKLMTKTELEQFYYQIGGLYENH